MNRTRGDGGSRTHVRGRVRVTRSSRTHLVHPLIPSSPNGHKRPGIEPRNARPLRGSPVPFHLSSYFPVPVARTWGDERMVCCDISSILPHVIRTEPDHNLPEPEQTATRTLRRSAPEPLRAHALRGTVTRSRLTWRGRAAPRTAARRLSCATSGHSLSAASRRRDGFTHQRSPSSRTVHPCFFAESNTFRVICCRTCAGFRVESQPSRVMVMNTVWPPVC
jgi:hypothetical protein